MAYMAALFILFSSHGAGPRCVDVLAKGVSLSHVPRIASQVVLFDTSEVFKHGSVLKITNKNDLADYKQTLLSRSGLYVFLLDRTGHLAIDHHLPLPVDYSMATFHGTHRGLLRQREQDFSFLGKPEVIFAGELMVSAGKIVWISDGSTFFHDAPKVAQRPRETSREFHFRTRRERDQFFQNTTSRLLTIKNLMTSWGWIDGNTIIKQIENASGSDSLASWGFKISRKLALFERICRGQQPCWDFYLSLEGRLNRVAEAGGFDLPTERLLQLAQLDAQKASLLVQSLTMARDLGLVAVMHQQIDPQSGVPKQPLQDFGVALDWYLQFLEAK